ncbi:hypothetical protein V6N11_056825 [Hibiscus sabdariffa]|uniref:Uncharacterized protein n=1 Tax=Hibiscus sabdariffa TaxID=183260 RepID=A0ABR2T4Y6_9ROSI
MPDTVDDDNDTKESVVPTTVENGTKQSVVAAMVEVANGPKLLTTLVHEGNQSHEIPTVRVEADAADGPQLPVPVVKQQRTGYGNGKNRNAACANALMPATSVMVSTDTIVPPRTSKHSLQGKTLTYVKPLTLMGFMVVFTDNTRT